MNIHSTFLAKLHQECENASIYCGTSHSLTQLARVSELMPGDTVLYQRIQDQRLRQVKVKIESVTTSDGFTKVVATDNNWFRLKSDDLIPVFIKESNK